MLLPLRLLDLLWKLLPLLDGVLHHLLLALACSYAYNSREMSKGAFPVDENIAGAQAVRLMTGLLRYRCCKAAIGPYGAVTRSKTHRCCSLSPYR